MKCFIMAVVARATQTTLKRIIVGRVLTVELQIRARLDATAKM